MKRDLDLIREILLAIEADPKYNGTSVEDPALLFRISDRDPREIAYHLRILINGGYVVGQETRMPGNYLVFGLTMKGHDYVDSVRDPEIWRKTKESASRAGGFTLALLGDIATGFIKTQIKKHTGIDIDG